MTFEFMIVTLLVILQINLLILIFMVTGVMKILKNLSSTVTETAKQVNIIDRNTYPKQISKKF